MIAYDFIFTFFITSSVNLILNAKHHYLYLLFLRMLVIIYMSMYKWAKDRTNKDLASVLSMSYITKTVNTNTSVSSYQFCDVT